MHIDRFDHFVLTVADLDATCAFYRDALGMKILTFGDGRRALGFGDQKINLHRKGREFEPKAAAPTPGAGDFCLTTTAPLDAVIEHLRGLGIAIEDGPVARTGARAALRSIYFRDPDGSLVEISNES
jgi:catechol 2,3-dioxygenase-like lactoylglutathione lyase family enzyme